MDALIQAWRLAQTIASRFDLPDDSAWDHIMLADLWLRHPAARALIVDDGRLWPNERSPATADFYHHGVEVARRVGDRRQEIMALDRCAAFFMDSGNAKLGAVWRSRRDEQLIADPGLAKQLTLEGMLAGNLGRRLVL